MSEKMLTPIEVAELLGITKQRVSQLIHSGKIKATLIDGKHFIRPEDAEAAKHRKTGRPAKDERKSEAMEEEHGEVWEITIRATVEIRKGKKSDEEKDRDNDESE